MSEQRTNMVIERHFDPEGWAVDPYPLIPFQLPPGAARLDVRYDYSDPVSPDLLEQRRGNVVDIGIIGPHGFRGWSGSARREFSLTPTWATSGYRPGPLEPGRWQILLGLYKMAPTGCSVRIEVSYVWGDWKVGRLEDWKVGSSQPSNLPTSQCPWDALFSYVSEKQARWYRGDLHCHSHHSEAQGSLDDLLAAARAQGLDFLAITEHNTVSHLAELAGRSEPPSPLVIPAMEITTYRGHANVFGIRRWYDFRCRRPEDMAAVREAARAGGALFTVNHPKLLGPPWEWDDEAQADGLEVWQQPWPLFNFQSLGLWDGLLKQGHCLTAVGGSDKHQGPFDGTLGFTEVGRPATWVYAEELSAPGLMAGLRAGHVFISAGPAGPRLELAAEADGRRAMMGDRIELAPGKEARLRCRVCGADGKLLRLVSANGRQEAIVDAGEFEYEWTSAAGDAYWRAEVVEPPPAHQHDEPAAQMVVALSNPIYIVEKT